MKSIVLFENERVDDLYPFSITHCSWEIRCGALRLFEKIKSQFPKHAFSFLGRKQWVASFLKRFNQTNHELIYDKTLFLSGNVILNDAVIENILHKMPLSDNILIVSDGSPIGFFIENIFSEIEDHIASNQTIDLNHKVFASLEKYDIGKTISIDYIWDSLFVNGEQINQDVKYLIKHHSMFATDFHGVSAIKPTNIYIGNEVSIAPSVVIDASGGAVIIGNNVKIMPQSTIIGPCFIGDNTLIKIGAKIYEDNSIGEWCKIGGELENCIIHAYSNKQHDGFLGHSYLGEWVNLGADTNNSDLKNTYGVINMVLPDKEISTGRMFLGLMCGDHTKTGINSMFTTGTVAGVCGILVKEWFLPNFIKSFSWGGKANSPTYKFDKAIETAKIVTARRNVLLHDEDIELLKIEYHRQSDK